MNAVSFGVGRTNNQRDKHKHGNKYQSSVFFLYGLMLITFFCQPAAGLSQTQAQQNKENTSDSLVIVTHKTLQTSELKKRTLREIFTLQMPRWPDGTVTKVVVLDHRSRPHQVFTREFLNVMSYQLYRHWERVIFSGRASPPIIVDDFPALAETVAATPGAIGYLNTASLDESLKTLEIRD